MLAFLKMRVSTRACPFLKSAFSPIQAQESKVMKFEFWGVKSVVDFWCGFLCHCSKEDRLGHLLSNKTVLRQASAWDRFWRDFLEVWGVPKQTS